MIDKMDKKIFAIWIGVCLLGALLFSQIPSESNTSNITAYEQCLADNRIEMDESVLESYMESMDKSEITEEEINNMIKVFVETGDVTYGKEYDDNRKKISDEISRYTQQLIDECGDKI